MVKHNTSSKYQSIDSIAVIRYDDYREKDSIINKYHLERYITADKMKKLESLKKFLLFVKKLVLGGASHGVYQFFKEFVKEFAEDEALSHVAESINNKINDNSENEPEDFERREFVKFIVSILLE